MARASFGDRFYLDDPAGVRSAAPALTEAAAPTTGGKLDPVSLAYAVMCVVEQCHGDEEATNAAIEHLLASNQQAADADVAVTEDAVSSGDMSNVRGQEIGGADARPTRRAARQAALMEALERARQIPVEELARMYPPRPGADRLTAQQVARLRQRLAAAELRRR